MITLGPNGLGANANGFVVADGVRREIFWFSPRGELQDHHILDSLGGPQCISGLRVSVPEKGNAIAVYRHVCDERFPAQPVGHQSVANYQVMIGHRRLSPNILD